MKFLLSMIMVSSLSITSYIIAEDSPVYEANKAEYYVNVFKDGKDMDDLMKWSKEWAEWASEGELW